MINILHFDAFTSCAGKGNPAGIVLSAGSLSDAAMQSIARMTGFGDTAFITPSKNADFRIRYFAPGREVDLCGHATIAASIALVTHGPLKGVPLPIEFLLETRAGNLPINIDRNQAGELLVFMSQLPAQFHDFKGDLTLLTEALGISIADLRTDIPIVYGSTGRWTLIVPVLDLNVMRKMRPQSALFQTVLSEIPGSSIHPFCCEVVDAHAALHARHFSSPSSGTVEDPVTGTASGVLGAYFRKFVNSDESSSQPLIIEQGYEMGREGHVLVWATRNAASYVVRIAGTACFAGQQTAQLQVGAD